MRFKIYLGVRTRVRLRIRIRDMWVTVEETSTDYQRKWF